MYEDILFEEFLRKNCIRCRVPDPSNEPRTQVIIHEAHGLKCFWNNRYFLKASALIKVVPKNTHQELNFYIMNSGFDLCELQKWIDFEDNNKK